MITKNKPWYTVIVLSLIIIVVARITNSKENNIINRDYDNSFNIKLNFFSHIKQIPNFLLSIDNSGVPYYMNKKTKDIIINNDTIKIPFNYHKILYFDQNKNILISQDNTLLVYNNEKKVYKKKTFPNLKIYNSLLTDNGDIYLLGELLKEGKYVFGFYKYDNSNNTLNTLQILKESDNSFIGDMLQYHGTFSIHRDYISYHVAYFSELFLFSKTLNNNFRLSTIEKVKKPKIQVYNNVYSLNSNDKKHIIQGCFIIKDKVYVLSNTSNTGTNLLCDIYDINNKKYEKSIIIEVPFSNKIVIDTKTINETLYFTLLDESIAIYKTH